MHDNPAAAALKEIREREQQATPGPWGWFGNTDQHNVYLATRQWGRFIVMGFRRWGTQGARPMFATGRTWKTPPKSDMDFGPAGRMAPASEMFTGKGELTDADELAVYAVAPGAESRKDPRVYRADLSGIRNPDAEFIAGAREDVPQLLAAVDAALKFHQPRQLHELAFNPDGTPRCGHDPDSDPDAHYEGDDGLWYCESLPDGVTCSGCPESPDGEYADWPCDEYRAILAALTGKEADGGR